MKESILVILSMSAALVYCTDPCPMKRTCHECIQDPDCAWCAQNDFLPHRVQDGTMRKRCFSPQSTQHPCKQEDIINPDNAVIPVRNISVSSITANNSHVWISPQKIDLQLRIDKPSSIFVTFLNAPVTRLNTSGNQERIERVTLRTVELIDNSTNDINITYFSRCKGPNYGPWNFSNKCEGLHANDEITFQIFLQAKNCSDDPHSWKKYISIYPQGINASLIIKLQVICDCACEKEPEVRSQICVNNGDLVCGACNCNSNNFGERCECSKDLYPSVASDLNLESIDDNCRPHNNSIICSGHGTCICGVCECDIRSNPTELITGKYCECDNFSCPRAHGRICSDHGTCVCGKCVCSPGYIGRACRCSSDTMDCIPPNSTQPCSGNGECKCNQCKCKTGATGRYCETTNSNSTIAADQ